ncbi:MAG: arylsulfatase [bacterium]|nr:arylsulfatase [bacterium]
MRRHRTHKFRRFAVLAGVACLSLAAGVPADVAQAKPNIVLVVADDLGWNDVGYHGSEIETPNIDKLATQGVQLDRFYAFPLCSPTRAALLTGRSPIPMGIYGPLTPTGKLGLPLDEHLMPESFRAAGYQTFMTGKWHLGNAHVNYFPHNRGFDHFYGHSGPEVGYYTHLIEGGYDWQRNGKTVREEGYTTELIGKEAARLLRDRDRSKPVFLYVPFNAPHVPLEAPEKLIEKYAQVADERRRIYAAMVDAMDQEIGRILETLDKEGIRDSTIVFFLSDNGGSLRNGASNTPLRQGKGSVYEGGIRAPAVIHWPGVIEGGGISEQVITALDVFPTMAAAAEVTVGGDKPLDGKNLWPALRAGRTTDREPFILGANGSYTVLRGEWKLVRHAEPGDNPSELYNLSADPNEKRDLAAEHPEIVKELTARVDRLPKSESIGGRPPGRGRGRAGGPPGGRRNRPNNPTAPPERREPYAEAAARN